MGWFRKAAGWVASKVGVAAEGLGKLTHNKKMEEAGNKLQDLGDRLANNIGNTSSYDPSTATVRQTEDLSVKLAQYSKDAEQSADEMQSEIESEVKHFFEYIAGIIDENDISIAKSTIRKDHKDAMDAQRGFLKSYVAKRLSLDDRSCLEILKMSDGYEKERAMRTFVNKVLTEGKRELCNKLKESLEDLLDTFGSAFDAMQADQMLLLKNAEEAMNSIKDDTPSRENAQASASTVVSSIYLVDQILSEVD